MATLEDILARSRVMATGMGLDPGQSAILDNKPAFRALLDTAFSTVYNRRAKDKKNWHDLSVRHSITFTGGTGSVPPNLMREYLHTAEFQNADGDLISWLPWETDFNQTFTQLGYMRMRGDDFLYTVPNGGAAYDGTIYVTAISLPEYPADPNDDISMTAEIFDDVCYTLALAVRGEQKLN